MVYFSIVIPTFNRANFLTTAIDSVLHQSFNNFELIIIDDGSTDNTKEIVNNYTDKRIKYIYQKNQERSVARNNGINHSKGKYICFLDSDDYYFEYHLQTFYDYINHNNINKAMLFAKPKIHFPREYNIYEIILKSIIHPQHVCIHHETLKNIQFNPKLIIGEDIELWMRIANEYPIVHIEKETLKIVEHADRTVNYLKTNSFQPVLEVLRTLYKDNRWKNKISPYVKRTTISDCYFGISKYYMHQGCYFKSICILLRSIIAYPHIQFKHKMYLILSLTFLNKLINFNNDYASNIK